MFLVTNLRSGPKKHSPDQLKNIHFLFKNIHFGRYTKFPPNIYKTTKSTTTTTTTTTKATTITITTTTTIITIITTIATITHNIDNDKFDNNDKNEMHYIKRNFYYSPIRPLFLVVEQVLISEGPKGKFTMLAVITRITEKRIYVQKQDNVIMWRAEKNIRRI
jgi:hypothetical protein